MLLDPYGTVWTWGGNNYGQLGDGTNTDKVSPVQINGLNNIVAIATRCDHSLALKNDGTVLAWGCNTYGQLGDNTNTHKSSPVQVNGLNNIVAIASGFNHSLALKNDGTVWAWGYNSHGELGNNSTNNSLVPVPVSGLNGVIAIASGGGHCLALKSDNTAWAWGANVDGQLGNNSTTNSLVPVPVNNMNNVTAIGAGGNHSFAIRNDVFAWGNSVYGQLGDGFTISWPFPVPLISLYSINSVIGGYGHSLALDNIGRVYAWGYNYFGQLGNNSTMDSYSPIRLISLGEVTKIAAGFWHSLALEPDGTLWAWGRNNYGQLGNNSSTDSSIPVQVFYLPPYPESPHPYTNYYDNTWNYTHPAAASSLAITFSSDTKTEANYDKIYIMDSSGNNIPGSPFFGTSLANQTKIVPGNSFQIRLTSDISIVDYGFRITNIEAVTQPTGSKTLSLSPNKEYSIPFVVQGLDSIASKTFKLTYDPVKLDIVDLAAQTKPLVTSVGLVAGTDVNILSHSNGIITFKVNKTLPAGIPWTGTLNIFKFKAKSNASGSTDITSEVI
jgi:alpha-tubulin suppressor-like RCC1 family protein